MPTKIPQGLTSATIDRLTPSGLGIATVNGRRTRIANSLPGEIVEFNYLRRHRGGDDGIAVHVAQPHPERVVPRCPHTLRCGGCTLQHLDHPAQIRLHQAHLAEYLAAAGGPVRWLAPIIAMTSAATLDNSPTVVEETGTTPKETAAIYGYRRKARLGVKFVDKRDILLVGFRERGRSFVAEIESCAVLHPAVGERISALRALITSLEARRSIPQIEVAAGEGDVALIFRHTEPLSSTDQERLIAFATHPPACLSFGASSSNQEREARLQIFLQSGGLDTVTSLWPKLPPPLEYHLPAYGVSIAFRPTDFTQVNLEVNRAMVQQAITLLDLRAGEAVLDLYCGLGNFSLPLARCGARVTGIEGDPGLVARARENAQRNGLAVEFLVHDLSRGLPVEGLCSVDPTYPPYSKVLLDPPRSGAAAILPALAGLKVERIVYVSCNPETLARDAVELVQQHGYRLDAAGMMDMFPHTGHMESMAVFTYPAVE
ncbi:23S rRNA (uracil(1939)-C(5))-methyltransferase RlmD [Gammaproteobacteria bacterium]